MQQLYIHAWQNVIISLFVFPSQTKYSRKKQEGCSHALVDLQQQINTSIWVLKNFWFYEYDKKYTNMGMVGHAVA
jgi:hypothetical protein